jgi:hypothetical protein
MIYKNNFSKKNVLREREVLVNDLFYLTFVFIEDIFKRRQWGQLTKETPDPSIEVSKEFYANYEPSNLDDHSITFTVRGKTLELPHVVIGKLYELPEIKILAFPIKK